MENNNSSGNPGLVNAFRLAEEETTSVLHRQLTEIKENPNADHWDRATVPALLFGINMLATSRGRSLNRGTC